MLATSILPYNEDTFRRDIINAIVRLAQNHSRDISHAEEIQVESPYSMFSGYLDTMFQNNITLLITDQAGAEEKDESIVSDVPCEIKSKSSVKGFPQALLGAYTFLLMEHGQQIIKNETVSCLVVCISHEQLLQVYQLTIENCDLKIVQFYAASTFGQIAGVLKSIFALGNVHDQNRTTL